MLLSGQAAMRATRYNYNTSTPTPGTPTSLGRSQSNSENMEYMCGVSRRHRAQTPDSLETVSKYEKAHGRNMLLEFHGDQKSDMCKTKRVEVLRREMGAVRASNTVAGGKGSNMDVMKSIVFPDTSSMIKAKSETNDKIGECNNPQSSHLESLHKELIKRKLQREGLQNQNADLQSRLQILHKTDIDNGDSAAKFYDTANMNIGRSSAMKSPGIMSRNTLTSKEMYERQLATKKKVVF